MKTQILLIGGGHTSDTYQVYLEYLQNRDISLDHFRANLNWRNNLQAILGEEYDILIPQMPNNQRARYLEWKMWFERIIPLLDDDVILIGHSMGGIFLMKYLSENICTVKIKALFVLATPFILKGEYPLERFYFEAPLTGVARQVERIFIYHSGDDAIVPVICAHRYKNAFPNACLHIFDGLGHLNQKDFPQIIEDIRSLRQ